MVSIWIGVKHASDGLCMPDYMDNDRTQIVSGKSRDPAKQTLRRHAYTPRGMGSDLVIHPTMRGRTHHSAGTMYVYHLI